MDESNPNLEDSLAGLDESKRSTLKKLIGTGAFVKPVVASITMTGLSVDGFLHAAAAASNGTVSDQRLKREIAAVEAHESGFGLYRFKYLWSDTEYVGVLAQEVLSVAPHAVTRADDGFLRVDYDAIGVEMVPYADWSQRLIPANQPAGLGLG